MKVEIETPYGCITLAHDAVGEQTCVEMPTAWILLDPDEAMAMGAGLIKMASATSPVLTGGLTPQSPIS